MWHLTQFTLLCLDASHVCMYGTISWQSDPQNLLLSVVLAAANAVPIPTTRSAISTIATLPPLVRHSRFIAAATDDAPSSPAPVAFRFLDAPTRASGPAASGTVIRRR